MKKVIEVDADIDRVLATICDAALKKEGMQLFAHVKQLIETIKEQENIN